jgi:hypothetical protein
MVPAQRQRAIRNDPPPNTSETQRVTAHSEQQMFGIGILQCRFFGARTRNSWRQIWRATLMFFPPQEKLNRATMQRQVKFVMGLTAIAAIRQKASRLVAIAISYGGVQL